MKHSNVDPASCPKCDIKLLFSDPRMATWFRDLVKPRFPQCHISDSWRGEREQNEYQAQGRSDLKWPNSKHNKTDIFGNPSALALDLFRIDDRGVGLWEYGYLKSIWDYVEHQEPKVRWGGGFKKVDGPHFELLEVT